jgi:hypothetical protein
LSTELLHAKRQRLHEEEDLISVVSICTFVPEKQVKLPQRLHEEEDLTSGVSICTFVPKKQVKLPGPHLKCPYLDFCTGKARKLSIQMQGQRLLDLLDPQRFS